MLFRSWRFEEEDAIPVYRVNCVAAVRRIHAPVMLIAGELDQHMPPRDVRRIYDAAAEPKSWFEFPGAGHTGRPLHPDYVAALTEFLAQSATSHPSSPVYSNGPS